MKSILSALLLITIVNISCIRTGDNNPPPPKPPIDTSLHAEDINFGKLIALKDTLRVYDARSGQLLVASEPYGVLFNAYVNNTTVDDSLAYQPTPGTLLCMNINTGQVQFTKYFSPYYSGVSTSFPVIDGPNLYIGAYNYSGLFKLFAINKTTGETKWESEEKIAFDLEPYEPSLAQTSNTILIPTYDGPACFDKATGKLLWRNNSQPEFGRLDVFPAVYNNKLLATSLGNHAIFAFDVTDGKLLWKTDLPADLFVSNRTPLHAYGNAVYAFSRHSATGGLGLSVHEFDLNTGQMTRTMAYDLADWYIQFYDAYFFTYENVNHVFFPQRISKRLLSTGEAVWSTDLEGGTYDGVVMTPAYIYCTETDPLQTSSWQRLNILDQRNGKILKTFPIYSNLNFAPVVQDSLKVSYQPAKW